MKRMALYAVAFLLGIGSIITWRILTVKKIEKAQIMKTPLLTKQAAFTYPLPSEAISGIITSLSGTVIKHPRADENAELPLTKDDVLVQKDTIVTKEDGAISCTIPSVATISMKNNAELAIVNLVVPNISFIQIAGSTTYETTHTTNVKTIHALTEIASESAGMITVDAPIVKYIVTKGSMKIGFNDINNNTVVKTISANESLTFNDDTRKISIK